MCSGEETLPLCLVANFGSESDDIIVKEVLFKGQRIEDNISGDSCGFTWEVNNKYYTCSVRVRVVDGTSDRLPGSPSATPEALVMYAGRNPVDWGELSPKLKTVHSMFGCGQIKLLVAQSFKEDSTRLEAQEWAVEEGVEIIDFSEDEDEDENDDCIDEKFFASSPQKRVIEALQTCPWPNISMKKDTEGARASMDPSSVVGGGGGGIGDGDNFEALFAQLSTFRNRSTNMPDGERRAFAERVAMQFYNAIGGENSSDEEETKNDGGNK